MFTTGRLFDLSRKKYRSSLRDLCTEWTGSMEEAGSVQVHQTYMDANIYPPIYKYL